MAVPDPILRLEALLGRAVLDIEGLHGCEVAVVVGPRHRWSLAAAGCDALELAALEFTVWDGPLLDVTTDGLPVVVHDLRDEDRRWPVLAACSGGSPARAVATLPLVVGGRPGEEGGGALVGVLTATSRRAGAFDAAEQPLLAAVVRGAALHVERAIAWLADAGDDVWQQAGSNVWAAVGIATVVTGLGMDDALAVLRGRAFREGRSLEEVADEVVLSGGLSLPGATGLVVPGTTPGLGPDGGSDLPSLPMDVPGAVDDPADLEDLVRPRGRHPSGEVPPGEPPDGPWIGGEAGVPEPVDIVLSGPIDRAAADEVERRVAGAPGAHRGRRVVVDVAEASFVSRHVLAALERGAWSRGTAVEVRSASAETRRVAEALGLRRVLLRGRGPAGYGG